MFNAAKEVWLPFGPKGCVHRGLRNDGRALHLPAGVRRRSKALIIHVHALVHMLLRRPVCGSYAKAVAILRKSGSYPKQKR